MSPSWYWMPDIIDNFFHDFGYVAANFYELRVLDPQFDMIFPDGTSPGNYLELRAMAETIEGGAGKRLDAFIMASKYKYEVGMLEFVNTPCHSWWEFASPTIARSALKL